MIVAVTGGKGGVGKSTVSLNLGRELDAVVVDGDLATADLPRGTGPDLHDVLAGRTDPVDAVAEFGSVKVLPCGRTLEGARAARLDGIVETVGAVERQYGTVVIDCPAGLARDVGMQLHSADVSVVVTTPKKPALLNAYRTRELSLNVETPLASVALNMIRDSPSTNGDDGFSIGDYTLGAGDGRSDDGRDGDGTEAVADRIEAAFGAPTTVVPEQRAVAEAQADWVPVRDHAPDAAAVDSFERLARRIEICGSRAGTRVDA
ncbi:chromosome partitioning protein ParA [Halorientalis sp. IM1011]|uniref:MinD/ParA family ATP-binding protein n=1 Tax=Halorientalis sp. IM1011 TaxID=1932360 RepID=UPI00097CD46B|nr:P-loop NTPase [Halorientalis sp. IM1011]AQL42156.1 chromosome partitioning protein ParA [Halorientalis sp. IM1011]